MENGNRTRRAQKLPQRIIRPITVQRDGKTQEHNTTINYLKEKKIITK